MHVVIGGCERKLPRLSCLHRDACTGPACTRMQCTPQPSTRTCSCGNASWIASKRRRMRVAHLCDCNAALTVLQSVLAPLQPDDERAVVLNHQVRTQLACKVRVHQSQPAELRAFRRVIHAPPRRHAQLGCVELNLQRQPRRCHRSMRAHTHISLRQHAAREPMPARRTSRDAAYTSLPSLRVLNTMGTSAHLM